MASIPRSRKNARSARSVGAAPDGDGLDEADLDSDSAPSRIATRRHRWRQEQIANNPVDFSGFPSMAGLRPVLGFLVFPVLLVVALVITGGGWPPALLYSLALLMGIYLAYSTLNSLELVLACLLLYLPFSTSHAISIAPMVNGTNMLLLLGAAGIVFQIYNGRGLFEWLPGTAVVYLFGLLSTLSGFTTMALPGGYDHLMYNELLSYKSWVEQFAFIVVVQCAIRDREAAKRVVIYMGIAACAVALYVIPEMLEKAGRSTIEKSRLEGPQQQSNNFGGFVTYTLMPVLAIFIVYIRNIRMWVLIPYLLLVTKILISTFSRGAYLAMALGAFSAGFFRGKGFLVFWASLGLVFVLIFPQVIPQSIMLRMQSLVDAGSDHNAVIREDQLDRSSRDRLILWRAAIRIALENPVTGLGFKSFPLIRNDYTEEEMLHVADPHSMYLALAAEMGLPVLALFLLILWGAYRMGSALSRNRQDHFVRAVGIGGVAATACYAVICVFGSRAVNLEFSAFFWTLYVAMQVMLADSAPRGWRQKTRQRNLPLGGAKPGLLPGRSSGRRGGASARPRRRRTNAFEQLENGNRDDPGR